MNFAAWKAMIAASLLGAGLAAPARAQDPVIPWNPEEVEDTATRPPPPSRPGTGQPVPGHWSAELSVAGMLDSNASRDDDEIAASGVAVGGRVGVQNRARRPTLRAEYGAAVHSYHGTDRWDRFTQRGRLIHTLWLGERLSLQTMAQGATGMLTLEHTRTDEISLAPRLEFRPDRLHRVRVGGAYRARRYHDAGNSTATGFLLEAEYRYRMRSWQYAELGLRYEDNDAELDRRSYARTSASAAYTHPLGEHDRVRLRTLVREVRYSHRLLGTAEGDRVHDWLVIPSVTWIHDLAGPLRTELEYRALLRRSNEDTREFDAHRALVTVRYRL